MRANAAGGFQVENRVWGEVAFHPIPLQAYATAPRVWPG